MNLRFQVFRVVFLITAVLLILWSIYEGNRATGRTLGRLATFGWDLYLGRDNVTPIVFFFFCLGNDTCSDAFVTVWLQEYPLILPILALVLVWGGAIFSVPSSKTN